MIVEQVRVILREVEKLQLLEKMAEDPLAGTFRLGIIPTLGPYLLSLILPMLNKQLPKLLIVYENKTENIVHELRRGELDAIILALPISTQG